MDCKLSDDENKIDLSNWGFDLVDKLDVIIGEHVSRVIADAFNDYPPALHAPFIWSDAPDRDPLIIELSLPLSSDSGAPVDFTVPLREFFAELREDINGEWSGLESDAALCRRMAQALHDEADKFTAHAKDVAASLTK